MNALAEQSYQDPTNAFYFASATTEEQIEKVKEICEAIQQNPLIKYCDVNDWGRFGNFDIMIVPETHDRFSTNRIKAIVSKAFKKSGARLTGTFPPEGRKDMFGFLEYDRDFWLFDIDFN